MNPVIVGLVDDIRSDLIPTDAAGKVVVGANGNITLNAPLPKNFSDPVKRDAFGHKLKKWFQALDAVAVGLNASIYDEKVVKDCLGDLFLSTNGIVGDPKDHFIAPDDYPEIATWAAKFK